MTDDAAIRLGNAVREARGQRGWTQDQLAEASGVSRPTINRCENAKGVTRPHTARALFLALGLDPRHLPVLLGHVTADEMGVPAKPVRVHSQLTEEAVELLESEWVTAEAAREWVAFLRWRVSSLKA